MKGAKSDAVGTTGCVFGQNIINTEQQLTWKQGESFVIETVYGNKTKLSQQDVNHATKTQIFEEVAGKAPFREQERIKDSPIMLRGLQITCNMLH